MTGIILDTNVVSEPKRPAPDTRVRAWFEQQDGFDLYLTATVLCELAAGIKRLPRGRRRLDFERWLHDLLVRDFAGRVLSFDTAAALIYGDLVAGGLATGRSPKMGDAQIAAVAHRDAMVVATRDVADFKAFGVPVVNPWQGT